MTPTAAISWALLWFGAAVVLLSCVGVLVMPTALSRLHYLSPASQLGAFCIALAVVLQERLNQGGVKALLLFLLLASFGAVVTHATGSAIYTVEGEGEAGKERQP